MAVSRPQRRRTASAPRACGAVDLGYLFGVGRSRAAIAGFLSLKKRQQHGSEIINLRALEAPAL
jgi:hypothetical protein